MFSLTMPWKYIIYICPMTGLLPHISSKFQKKHLLLDMRDAFTCSFTEFLPFCEKLYYLSNFKDFNTFRRAC